MRVPKPSLPVPRARSGSTAAAGESVDQNLALASPIEGIVVERNINPGQELRPDLQLANSPAMFRHHRSVPLVGAARCDESQLASLKRGQKVQLRSSAWPEESFELPWKRFPIFVDPASATVQSARLGHQPR